MSDQLGLKKGIDCIGVCVVYYCHDGKGNLLFTKRSQYARDEQGTWDVGARCARGQGVGVPRLHHTRIAKARIFG